MTEDHDLICRSVVHKFEVVSSFPVIGFLPNLNACILAFINFDNIILLLIMELTVSLKHVRENFNLFMVLSVELDLTNTITVNAVFVCTTLSDIFKTFLSCWLPFHVNVKPIGTDWQVLNFQISVSVLPGNTCFNECTILERVIICLFDQVSNDICILVICLSFEESISELRDCKSMETGLLGCHSEKCKGWFFVSFLKFI